MIPRKIIPHPLTLVFLFLLSSMGTCASLTVAVFQTSIPQPSIVASAQISTVLYDDAKTVIGPLGDVDRIDIALSKVPLIVQQAVLSAEDRSFYSHRGFSPLGIARALRSDASGGSLQGGSTLTQQYTKNAFLSQERTLSRKVDEFILSLRLESDRDKNRILQDYLNVVYFGRGTYGIEAAAHAYFGASASKLTLGQGAMLAALLKSPERLEPDRNLARLRARWKYVLDGMVSQGWLSADKRRTVKFPSVLPRKRALSHGNQSYLIDAVRSELSSLGLDPDSVRSGGLRIVTTLNARSQKAAVDAVREQSPTTQAAGLRVGLAAVRPGTGEIVALYGGNDYAHSQLNNATQAIGQAGSTFKPFALAAALSKGVSLDSWWNGTNGIHVNGYKVINFGDESWGQISLREATVNSVNSAFVQLSDKIGVASVVKMAERAGIPEDTFGMRNNLTFVLGTASPHPLDMASAYATFAAHGKSVSPTLIKSITNASGQVIYSHDPTTVQALRADVADQVTDTLCQVVTRGTGYRAAWLSRPAAGKTGTTDNNMSAWFVGYTPELSAAVMLVKDGTNGKPVSLSGTGGLQTVTGGSFPTMIWTAFMAAALKGTPVQDFTHMSRLKTPQAHSGSPNNLQQPSRSSQPFISPTTEPTRPARTSQPATLPSVSPSQTPTATPSSAPAPTSSPSDTQSPTPAPTQIPTPTTTSG